MFTTEQVRRYIDNRAYFARGQSYMRERRVEGTSVSYTGGVLRLSAGVRGHGSSTYSAFIEYDEHEGEFVGCGCSCPAIASAKTGCKHVAALALTAVRYSDRVEDAMRECARREAAAPAWAAQWKDRMRELLRRQQELEAQQAQQARRQYVERLVSDSGARRRALAAPVTPEGAVAIAVTLIPEDGVLHMEMRIGVTRMYVVRGYDDFARRMASGARHTYGKELTLDHREDAFRPQDRELLRLIALTLAPGHSGGSLDVTGAYLDALMRTLLARGEEVSVQLNHETVRVPVVADEPQLGLRVSGEAGSRTLTVRTGAAVCGAAGAYFFDEKAVRCVTGEPFTRMRALLDVARSFPSGLPVDEDMLPSVCAHVIAPARAMLAITEGADVVAAHSPDEMRARFYVDMDDQGRILCRARFAYGETEAAPDADIPGIRRDTLMESAALEAMRAVFTEEAGPGEAAFTGGDEDIYALLGGSLPQLERHGDVMISERLARMNVQTKRPMQLGVSVQGGALLVKADLGGYTQEELRAAYDAHRQKRKFVRLKSGAFLSGEALEQAADAAQMLDALDMTAEQAEAGGTTQAARALYLDAALKERKSITLNAPDAVRAWIERLEAARATDVQPPAGLKAELRGYQRTGLSWLCALAGAGFGGILADDMGLGKTIQALAMLLAAREQGEAVRALVVCPASLQLNWKMEAARFAPGLTCQVVAGGAAERARQIAASQGVELLITSYDQLRRDVRAYEGVEFSHVLLDEAQVIKNAASQGAKSVKALKAAHRFAMTGTPVENRLSELWSIFDFLMPGYLLTYKKFRERFESPIVRDGDERAQARLRQMCSPFILRRMKKDVLDDLPEKVETTMTSEMTPAQRKLYAAHAANLVAQAQGGIAAQDRMRVLAGLTRLRQLCCDPRLCLEDYAGGSGKLDQCLDVVRDALGGGHSILLFSQFTSMLDLLRDALAAEGIAAFLLTGDTPKEERLSLVERFNAGQARVFLISLKAGGTGLNLTGADVVIHYDPWWNIAAQNQATDRAYRIGQTRGVQVIRLIAGDTIEERILKLQEAKRQLSDSVLGEENLFTIDTDTLRELLG